MKGIVKVMLKKKYKLCIGFVLAGVVCLLSVLGINKSGSLANTENINNSQIKVEEDDVIEPDNEETIIMDDYVVESKSYLSHSKEEHKKLMNKIIKKEIQSGEPVYILSDDEVHILNNDKD